MGKGSDSTQQNDYVSRFERRDRIERRLSFIVHAIVVAAFAYWIYGMQVAGAEDDAVIEACRNDRTMACIEKARAEYRNNH